MERAEIIDIPAERLVAGYQRARRIWGPFHVVWADLEGRVHWVEPDWCDTIEIPLAPFAMTEPEARRILDELERSAPAEHAWDEIERRSQVDGGHRETVGPTRRGVGQYPALMIIGSVVLVGIFVAYFLPSIVAWVRGVRHSASIAVINVFLGWTIIGWVVALAMAVVPPAEA